MAAKEVVDTLDRYRTPPICSNRNFVHVSPPARTPNANYPGRETPIRTPDTVEAGHLVSTPTALSPPTAGTPIAHSMETNDAATPNTPTAGSPNPTIDPVEETNKSIRRRITTKTGENGDPIREQDRFSYENMLIRYGVWSRIRGQIMVYIVLIAITLVYKGHSDQFKFFREIKTVRGRHIQCCCDVPKRFDDVRHFIETFEEGGPLTIVYFLMATILGLCGVLWERFIGRRKMLLTTTILCVLASVILMFPHQVVHQIGHLLLNLCTMVSHQVISMVNLSEMLPYETRYLSAYSYTFAYSISIAIANLHVYIGFSIFYFGLGSAISFAVAFALVYYCARDSICHMNIRNDVDVIEKIIREEEQVLYDENPLEGKTFHDAVAKKILEDLVYLDQDELKLSDFFKKLWKNWAMIEIILGLFHAISSGIHQFELSHYKSERFADPYYLTVDKLIGFALAGALTFTLRKSHRVRVIGWLLAGLLLTMSLRHQFVLHDERNQCADVHIVRENLSWMNFIISVTSICFGKSLSDLRISTALCYRIFDERLSLDFKTQIPLYGFHLLIILITLARSKTKLPYSLYLFDLMPTMEKSDDSKIMKVRTMEESGFLPTVIGINNETVVDASNPRKMV